MKDIEYFFFVLLTGSGSNSPANFDDDEYFQAGLAANDKPANTVFEIEYFEWAYKLL